MEVILSWREVSALEAGTRVRFASAWDIFPTALVKEGTVGTLVENGLNEIQSLAMVLPDCRELRRELSEWDGEIYLCVGDESQWDEPSPLSLIDPRDYRKPISEEVEQ